MLAFYVNRRRGSPQRLPFADVRWTEDLEHNRVGYFCGDWDCYAMAMQEIDEDIARAVQRELARTRGAAA
jgi:hypothetical protein